MYAGAWGQGLVLFLAWAAASVGCICVLMSQTGSLLLAAAIAVIVVGIGILSAVTAFLRARRANSPEAELARRSAKDAYLAVFLTQFFPGIGHLYLRKWVAGVLLLCLLPGLFVVMAVVVYLLLLASRTGVAPSGNPGPGMAVVTWSFGGLVLLCCTAACALAWRAAPAERRGGHGGIIAVCLMMVLIPLFGLGAGLVLNTWVVAAFRVPTGSMEPTIMVGDKILVWKVPSQPQRGDLVVFINPMDRSQKYVKRVAATEGETVEFRDGVVCVNGARIATGVIGRTDYPTPRSTDGLSVPERYGAPGDPFTVPAGCIFVVGDNGGRSYDSRAFGPIPVGDVVGKAYKRYRPLSRAGPIE